MRKNLGFRKSNICRQPVAEGLTIEEVIRQSIANKEPIEATAPMIYTKKGEGVRPEHDIRSDKWDIAIDAVDKFNASQIAENGAYPEEPDQPQEQPKNE